MNKKTASKEIRRTTKAKEKTCYICNENITETHHIVPVRVLTGIVLRFNAMIDKLIIPVVALCPNHHHKLHVLMNDINGDTTTTEYEKEKYAEIVDMCDYIENYEYGDVYNYSVDKTKDTVLHNLER